MPNPRPISHLTEIRRTFTLLAVLVDLSGWRRRIAYAAVVVLAVGCAAGAQNSLAQLFWPDRAFFDNTESAWNRKTTAEVIVLGASALAAIVFFRFATESQPERRRPSLYWCGFMPSILVPLRMRHLMRRLDGSVPWFITTWQVLFLAAFAGRNDMLRVPPGGQPRQYLQLVAFVATGVLVVAVTTRRAPWHEPGKRQPAPWADESFTPMSEQTLVVVPAVPET